MRVHLLGPAQSVRAVRRRGRVGAALRGGTIRAAGLALAVAGVVAAGPAGEALASVPHPSSVSRGSTTPAPVRRHCPYTAKLVPTCGVALGAYSLPTGSQTQVEAFASFEKMTGRHLDIAHVYHRGTEKFPTASERAFTHRVGRDRRLLVNWKPENGLTWAQVADGQADRWIDAEAAYLRSTFTTRFYLTIHHEPEEEVRGAGSGFTALDYRAMYRHVVDRFRAARVTNVVYVMNYMGAQKWAGIMDALYPGDDYVDWIAFDPYMTGKNGPQRGSFANLVNIFWGHGPWQGMYDWAHRRHSRTPLMLAEWGIGEKPGYPGWKASLFRSVAGDLADHPQLKALVYFSNPKGASGDARANTSAVSLAGFVDMVTSGVFQR